MIALDPCLIICKGVGNEKALKIIEIFRINNTFDQLARDNAPDEFQYPFRINGCDEPVGQLTRFYLTIFPGKRWGYLVDRAQRALMNLEWADFAGRHL